MERIDQSVTGFDLRYVLTTILVAAGRTMTVAELASAVEGRGIPLNGRPSKAISDALRSEVRKGRVIRVGWGRYHAASKIPRSTLGRIKARARAVEAQSATPDAA